MPCPVVAFVSGRSNIGTTALVQHLAWMLSDLGLRVLAADFDPQASLTSTLLDEGRLEDFWQAAAEPDTVYGSLRALMEEGVTRPRLEQVTEGLALLPGDPALSRFELPLSKEWLDGLENQKGFPKTSAFWRLLQDSSAGHEADLVLIDPGPNLAAVSRAALIASDSLVIPVALDPLSLRALRVLGSTLRGWRDQWEERVTRTAEAEFPTGRLESSGYILGLGGLRQTFPTSREAGWHSQIPAIYQEAVLGQPATATLSIKEDPHCIFLLESFPSLISMAREVHKPIFHLKPADGAAGSHLVAIQRVQRDFEKLAREICRRVGVEISA
jgi:chromosome partitioning protein